eukprot:Seg1807.6 transcript_id=Seg1807.6/GoldUCD/mRNA.D3Y31 product="hypothetical protein" protein_id=Seg1807.6/GoldUCD/D3Y31
MMLKRIKSEFDIRKFFAVVFILLTVVHISTSKMKCRRNSICTRNNPDSCCRAINHIDGICSPKITRGRKCHPTTRAVVLASNGIAFSSCGCAGGLTCTRIKKKRRNRKGGKKAYKIRYKCLPVPKENREISERWR